MRCKPDTANHMSKEQLDLPDWIDEDKCYYFVEIRRVNHVAIGGAVRERRKALKVSLRAVAKWMNVSAPYLSDLERGLRNWSQHRLDNVSDVLDMFERMNAKTTNTK